MQITQQTRDTLLAIEMDHGDTLQLTFSDDSTHTIEILDSWAHVYSTTLKQIKVPQSQGKTVLHCGCQMLIDGHEVKLIRWVGDQRSFYEPWELFGMRIWFDATVHIFDHLNEAHGPCKPRKDVRLAIQEVGKRICPVLLHPWCPLPKDGLKIEDCYQGMDCWMGPYFGADAHGGLDINHPAGTVLWTPFAIDDQAYYNQVCKGDNNNRWQGSHTWADGSRWLIRACHLIKLLTPEHTPSEAGMPYALSAGVHVGDFEHTHFAFGICEPDASDHDQIFLDPWILFWQMYQDRKQMIV